MLKNFLTYVDDLDELSVNNKEISEEEFKRVLDAITGDKVNWDLKCKNNKNWIMVEVFLWIRAKFKDPVLIRIFLSTG